MEDRLNSWRPEEYTRQAFASKTPLHVSRDALVAALAGLGERWLPAVLLPSILLLWGLSLPFIEVDAHSDLGWLTALPLPFYSALFVLLLSFSLVVFYRPHHSPVLFLHLATLALLLYGTPAVLPPAGAAAPDAGRGTSAEWRAASTPAPGLAALVALLREAAGDAGFAALARWAPFFLCLLISGALYLIIGSLSEDQRLVWSTLWFFNLTGVGLARFDGISGFAYFIYLALVGILLRWFRRQAPVQMVKFRSHPAPHAEESFFYRRPAIHDASGYVAPAEVQLSGWWLLLILVICLTLTLALSDLWIAAALAITLAALAAFHRITPRRLAWIAGGMIACWALVSFFSGAPGRAGPDLGMFPALNGKALNVMLADAGSGQALAALVGYALMALAALLALEGLVWRLVHRMLDLTLLLLGVASVLLLPAVLLDAERLFTAYNLALPVIAFFIAALFYVRPFSGRSPWTPVLMTGLSLILLGGFVFAYFGGLA